MLCFCVSHSSILRVKSVQIVKLGLFCSAGDFLFTLVRCFFFSFETNRGLGTIISLL